LPINTWGDYLCAYSSRGKLWVSLIEKAYLKLHGGYEFMGSNSSRDLYTLTGWLPEKIHIRDEDKPDIEALWQKLYTGAKKQ
jgi:calpain-7